MHSVSPPVRFPTRRAHAGPMVLSGLTRRSGLRHLALLALLELLVGLLFIATAQPAAAQMQIPNPLIRPRSVTNPAAPAESGAPMAEAGAAGRAAPAGNAPIALNANGTPAAAEDPYTRNLAELKDRFAGFYVSAIVGKQAMLRRSSAARAASTAAQPAQAVGASMAPVSLAGAAAAPQARSDSVMVADGELLDSVGTTGALVAKVARSQVAIYYVQETMVLPGGKLVGKRVIVFTGELENSGATAAPLIVLERPDPAYKRMITVETKTRASAAGTTDASAATNPPASATPGQLQ